MDHAKQTISSQQNVYEAKGIQPHMEYQFWVTASTRIGEGQSSRVVSQVATSRGILINVLQCKKKDNETLQVFSNGIDFFMAVFRIVPVF